MFIKLPVLCLDFNHVAIVTNEGKVRENLLIFKLRKDFAKKNVTY